MMFPGADPVFLERGFICIKVGGSFCLFYLIFIGYLKTRGEEGCSSEPPEPPLDPPLVFRFDELISEYDFSYYLVADQTVRCPYECSLNPFLDREIMPVYWKHEVVYHQL